MNIIKLFLVGLFIGATTNIAIAAEQNDLPKQLMQVLGFDSMLESVHKDTIKMVEGQMDGVMGQIKNAYPNIPEATMKEFNVAAQKFGRRITDSWNATEAARIYSTSLVEGLPEKDMRAAIEHYKTPEGQLELKVINEAMNKTNGYIMGSIQKETDLAMKDFLKEITALVERARNNQK